MPQLLFVPQTDNSLALAAGMPQLLFVPQTDNSLALAVRLGHEEGGG